MTPPRDRFCHACGAAFADVERYPRRCGACHTVVWANPAPVAVVLVPIVDGDRTGLLVVRRAVAPHVGRLALVSGFLEAHETWQVGAAREVAEETGVVIDAAALTLIDAVSTSPRSDPLLRFDRLLLFASAPPLPAAALPPFTPDPETSARGLVFGPGGLDELLAFPLHAAAARRWFGERGVSGSHDHVER